MSLKQVVSFAFVGSIALTLLLLSCTLTFNEADDNKEFTKNSYGLFGMCVQLFFLFLEY